MSSWLLFNSYSDEKNDWDIQIFSNQIVPCHRYMYIVVGWFSENKKPENLQGYLPKLNSIYFKILI